MNSLIKKALASLEEPVAMRIFVFISFLESALIPIPIETLSIPLLTARKNPWPIAIWGSIGSVLGGIAGYLIGYALLGTVGQWIINTYGMADKYEQLKEIASANLFSGCKLIFLGAISPIPYKLVCIASGAIHFPFLLFLLVSVIGRSLRFCVFALAFHWFGDSLRAFILHYPRTISIAVILLMIGGFALAFV